MLNWRDLSGDSERNSSQSFLPLSVSRTFADQSPVTCSCADEPRSARDHNARPAIKLRIKTIISVLRIKFSFPPQPLVLQQNGVQPLRFQFEQVVRRNVFESGGA